jgi:hypothetical protein
MSDLIDAFIEHYGDRLLDPYVFPAQAKHQMKLFKYMKQFQPEQQIKETEENENEGSTTTSDAATEKET